PGRGPRTRRDARDARAQGARREGRGEPPPHVGTAGVETSGRRSPSCASGGYASVRRASVPPPGERYRESRRTVRAARTEDEEAQARGAGAASAAQATADSPSSDLTSAKKSGSGRTR